MVYLRVTGIFNTPGNGNLQDFTSYQINFLDFRFQEERTRFGNSW